MTDHTPNDTHRVGVGHSGGATVEAKPTVRAPRRTKFTGQSEGVTQEVPAGDGMARSQSKPKAVAPSQLIENTADQMLPDTHLGCVSGADQTFAVPKTNTAASDPQKSPQGARAAKPRPDPNSSPPRATKGVQQVCDTHSSADSLIDELDPHHGTQFVDPTIAQIRETWKQRQDMVRAMTKLTMQAKAILRRFTDGDKTEAAKLYSAITKGKPHPLAEIALSNIGPLLMSRDPLEEYRKITEKRLVNLAKTLPIVHMVDQIKGLGLPGLAAIVGEAGDLSKYKSVSAVWKRCGLAVIDGQIQRRVKDAKEAAIHGYSPSRRSVLWTLTDSLFKAQSAGMKDGAEPGPYRALYDQLKAVDLANGLTKLHSHRRACRRMTKALLEDLTLEWRKVAGVTAPVAMAAE